MVKDYPAKKQGKIGMPPNAMRFDEALGELMCMTAGGPSRRIHRITFAAPDQIEIFTGTAPPVTYYPEKARWKEAGSPVRHSGTFEEMLEFVKTKAAQHGELITRDDVHFTSHNMLERK